MSKTLAEAMGELRLAWQPLRTELLRPSEWILNLLSKPQNTRTDTETPSD